MLLNSHVTPWKASSCVDRGLVRGQLPFYRHLWKSQQSDAAVKRLVPRRMFYKYAAWLMQQLLTFHSILSEDCAQKTAKKKITSAVNVEIRGFVSISSKALPNLCVNIRHLRRFFSYLSCILSVLITLTQNFTCVVIDFKSYHKQKKTRLQTCTAQHFQNTLEEDTHLKYDSHSWVKSLMVTIICLPFPSVIFFPLGPVFLS